MHNGVFRELRTAVRFYSRYTVRNSFTELNPETGAPWDPPEVTGTVDREELGLGQPLDESRIDDLVAFLRLLTDRRYEPLLD
ncbi:Methylamine utilization protein MauG precursor [compost metagenome]